MRSTASTESTTRSGAAYKRSEARNTAHDSIKKAVKTSAGVKVADAKPQSESWGTWFRFLGVRAPRQAAGNQPPYWQGQCDWVRPSAPVYDSVIGGDCTPDSGEFRPAKITGACDPDQQAEQCRQLYSEVGDSAASYSFQVCGNSIYNGANDFCPDRPTTEPTPQSPTPFSATNATGSTGGTFQTPHSAGQPTGTSSTPNHTNIVVGSAVGGSGAIGGTVGLILIGRHCYKRAAKALKWAPDTPAPRTKHTSESNSIEFENGGTAQTTSNV